LISLHTKNAFSKRRDFETNLNEKDQNAMLDILKLELHGGARPCQLLPTMNKTQVKSGQTLAQKDLSIG
jgi:hypothetical protein